MTISVAVIDELSRALGVPLPDGLPVCDGVGVAVLLLVCVDDSDTVGVALGVPLTL